MTTYNNAYYYIPGGSLSILLNVHRGYPNHIVMSTAGGARISCYWEALWSKTDYPDEASTNGYLKSILGYASDGISPRRWPLTAVSTSLASTQSNSEVDASEVSASDYGIFVRIDIAANQAMVVLTKEEHEALEWNLSDKEDEEGNLLPDYESLRYVWIRIGTIFKVDASGYRSMDIDYGCLDTFKAKNEERSDWYTADRDTKRVTMQEGWWFNAVRSLIYTIKGTHSKEGQNVDVDITHVVTSEDTDTTEEKATDSQLPTVKWLHTRFNEWMKGRFVRKDNKDGTENMQGGLHVGGSLDVSRHASVGSMASAGHASAGSLSVAGESDLIGNVTVHELLEAIKNAIIRGDLSVTGDTTFGTFQEGMLGAGARVSGVGFGEFDALRVRKFLDVPELRHNRIYVYVGNQWRAPGGGVLEQVVPDVDGDGNVLTTGYAVLKLEDGEVGTIAENDLCQGIFHHVDGENATETRDDGRGNFLFQGFYTSYFRITEITEKGNNSVFRYALREKSERWPWQFHPSAMMNFVCYANPTNKDRQTARYSTLRYERYLKDMKTWEFGEENIGAQFGDLDNLRIFGLDMRGYSAYLNNIYVSGTIENVKVIRDTLTCSLSRPDGTVADGETMKVTMVLKDSEGVSDTRLLQADRYDVERMSLDAEGDAEWNRAMSEAFPDGIHNPMSLTFDDVPEGGASFTVTSQRQVKTTQEDGTEVLGPILKATAVFLMQRAYAQEDFRGAWSSEDIYVRTTRMYPSVTHGGCKWYLSVSDSQGEEPSPSSSVWRILYGVEDVEIRFYDMSGHRLTHAAMYPGNVDLELEPRMVSGSFDLSEEVTAWRWTRYTGRYGEQTDTRPTEDRQSDDGWNAQRHDRVLRIRNEDMPPTWGSGSRVNFIISAEYQGGQVTNVVSV